MKMNLDFGITFESYIIDVPEPTIKTLLLSHCTEGNNLKIIFEGRSFLTSPCGNFSNEELAYFFYGKPSYSTNNKPSYFILKSKEQKIGLGNRLSPLDTGGIVKKYYNIEGEEFHKNGVTGFCIECKDEKAVISFSKKIISKFFNSSNYDYFIGRIDSKYIWKGMLRSQLKRYPLEYARVCEHISHARTSPNDHHKNERQNSIEIQYKSNVNFSDYEWIKLVCYEFDISEELQETISNSECETIFYSNHRDEEPLPGKFSEDLQELTKTIMKKIQFNK